MAAKTPVSLEVGRRLRGLRESLGIPKERVALAKRGEHSNRNLRVAHLLCNIKKGARDITHQRYLL